jgi:hypothetical protein
MGDAGEQARVRERLAEFGGALDAVVGDPGPESALAVIRKPGMVIRARRPQRADDLALTTVRTRSNKPVSAQTSSPDAPPATDESTSRAARRR